MLLWLRLTPLLFHNHILPCKALDVRAMYSYNASQPGDLCITEGDRLTVLDQSEPNWWKARDAQGRVGYIPSNYVRPAGIESEP